MHPIIQKEDPYKIGELTNRAFKFFCLPRGVLHELEWCIYQVPGFERARWDEVLHSNYVPEDLRPIVLAQMDEVERYISHTNGMYHATLTLLLANIFDGNVGASGCHQLSKVCNPSMPLSTH